MIEQIDYNEHCNRLHGIEAPKLTKEQNIKVDSKVPFKLDSALDIEDVGTEDHMSILHSWYTKGVATTVLTKSTNKAETDVNEDRSKELLTEICNVTTKGFSNVFKVKLREEVGDISYSFTAKWSQIETAFYNALGNDQVIPCYSKFFEEGPSSYEVNLWSK